MVVNDLTIVVCCNKRDYFLTRICVASIRYYYSNIAIELVKDLRWGSFSSDELETHFNVKPLTLSVDQIGWGAAKIFYLFKSPSKKKVLFLDSDIVFIGSFLERMLAYFEENEFVVSAEIISNPRVNWIKDIYFDINDVALAFPNYIFPGYVFNTGQIFLTTGVIEKRAFSDFFDFYNYPYWKIPELFPMVDQSLLNYLLPTLASQGSIKLAVADFMIWSKSSKAQQILLSDVIGRHLDSGLIHWAGDLRTPSLKNMSRSDILQFFELFYYSRIRLGRTKMILRKLLPSILGVARKTKIYFKDLRLLKAFCLIYL
jgi:hypothetical protein